MDACCSYGIMSTKCVSIRDKVDGRGIYPHFEIKQHFDLIKLSIHCSNNISSRPVTFISLMPYFTNIKDTFILALYPNDIPIIQIQIKSHQKRLSLILRNLKFLGKLLDQSSYCIMLNKEPTYSPKSNL